jgi:hypothetical protein
MYRDGRQMNMCFIAHPRLVLRHGTLPIAHACFAIFLAW